MIWSTTTVFVMLLLNWGVAILLKGELIEYSFLVGVVIVGLIWFMTSTGGIGSNIVRLNTQAQTGIKVDEEKQTFNPSIVFYTAIGYTVVALFITIVYYKDYFIS